MMKAYLPYVERLEDLVRLYQDEDRHWTDAARLALDGEPRRQLRKAINLTDRRADGAFFTSRELAQRLLGRPSPEHCGQETYFDPTCGAGDLLLAAARRLPVNRGLSETLSFWGERIAGYDKHSEFVRAAKARLAILAMCRGARPNNGKDIQLDKVFPLIRVSNALTDNSLYKKATHVLLNPPFCAVDAPAGCKWACGSVTAASLFVETALTQVSEGTLVSAILPDVLRSGSRYEAWRQSVKARAVIDRIRTHGLFDVTADIDVFLLHLHVVEDAQAGSWTTTRQRLGPCDGCVRDKFAVHVGPVVPHRHKLVGPACPYIHAHNLPRWEIFSPTADSRRFSGRTFKPPFVVVRRTSRPGDEKRAVATTIIGDDPVAVENHLLVFVPFDARLSTCEALVARLRLTKTDVWLDRRIRCRHLTVRALAELPWWRDV